MSGLASNITSLLGTQALWAFVVMLAVSPVVARLVQRRWLAGSTVLSVWLAIVALEVVIAFTLLRDGIPSRLAPSALVDWSLGIETLVTDPFASSQFVLNVLLFVPLGLTFAWLTRRPRRALAGAAGVSLVVEVLQAVTGVGANDVVDLVANAFGAAVGVGLALVLRVVRQGGRIGTPRSRIAANVVGLGLAAGLLVAMAILTADAHRHEVREALEDVFTGTTLEDVRRWEANGEVEAQIFSAIEERSDGQRDAGTVREQRYPATRFGVHRCVFVVWTDTSVTFRDADGSECARFIDSDRLGDGTWTPP